MSTAELVEHSTSAARLPVRVIRSTRRTKTSAAREVDGAIEVRIPAAMSDEQARAMVDKLVRRIEQKIAVREAPVDLAQRARTLAALYSLPLPQSIEWATNQRTLWGSCAFEEGRIRISSRLARAPGYVVDYVILHELTHLVESNHSDAFHALMRRFPKHERAEGFLEAMESSLAADRYTV